MSPELILAVGLDLMVVGPMTAPMIFCIIREVSSSARRRESSYTHRHFLDVDRRVSHGKMQTCPFIKLREIACRSNLGADGKRQAVDIGSLEAVAAELTA